MHVYTPRNLFRAKVATEILDKGVTPTQALETVRGRISTDPDLTDYRPPPSFLSRNYPSGNAVADAKAELKSIAEVMDVSVEQVSQRVGGGLKSAVHNAQPGVPNDLPKKPSAPILSQEVSPHPLGAPATQVGLAKTKDATPFEGWDGSYYGREAMAFLVFPGFHSKAGKESDAYKSTLGAISQGGNPMGTRTMTGAAVINSYGEFADWAMQRQGLPDRPPPAKLAECLDTAASLDGADAGRVKATLQQKLQPGATPVLVPFEVPGHQTYVSFEVHPQNSEKVIMRYFDRQRPDMDLQSKSGKTHIPGYLGAHDERNKSTELCFEFDKSAVTQGNVVDTLYSSVKGFDGISPARANMTQKLAAMADNVYAAPDSRPQIAQAGKAINCTWASFESFLSHVHGDQFKTESASMREFIVERHLVPQQGGFDKQALIAARQGIDKALINAQPGEGREALLRAKQNLGTIG